MALIGAAATILAALIAGVLAVNTGTVEVSLPESGASRDDLRDTITSLEQENDELRSTNEDLESQLDGARDRNDDATLDDTPPNTSPDAPGPSGAVAREGRGVALTWGHGLDLDSDATTAPDWGVSGDAADGDIVLYSGPSLGGTNGAEMAVMPELPSFSDCRRATGLTTQLPVEQTEPETHLCVRTNEGAYAYVGIVAETGDPSESVSLDITVWSSS